jgi:hypothetical protein
MRVFIGQNDVERLREVLRYHITTSPLNQRDVRNNHISNTQAGHPLRLNLNSGVSYFSVLGSCVQRGTSFINII